MTSRHLGLAALGLALAAAAGPSTARPAGAGAPIVFFDIAGPDMRSQAAFYREVFGWDIGADGRFTVRPASPLPAALRVEDPRQGPIAERVVYIGVPDITATLAAIKAHGGETVFPRLEVPGAVIVALFKDPAGNRMGLVEMDGDRAKVPPAQPQRR